MDKNEIREFCRKLLATGMRPMRVQHHLTVENFDPALIEEIVKEYTAQWQAERARRVRLRKLAGLALFLSCGGLFVYYVCFAVEGRVIFVFPLLAPALWGLLWGFGPPLWKADNDR
jgi:hypothetical protein